MKARRLTMCGVIVMAALAAAGCGGSAPPQAPPAEPPAQTAAVEAPAPASETPVQPVAAPVEHRPAPATPAPRPAVARPESVAPVEPAREEPPKVVEPIVVTLPVGTALDVVMVDAIGSRTSQPGDVFHAKIAKDVVHEGRVVVPQGTPVTGVVTEAVPLGKIGGTAKLAVEFTGAVLPSGETLAIRATLAEAGKSESGKDAATIGGAAAAGAVLGRVLSKDNKAKGTLLGALAGAAAGGAIATKTKGEEIEIPAGTNLTIHTETPTEVRIRP